MVTEHDVLKALDHPCRLHRLLAIVDPGGSADNRVAANLIGWPSSELTLKDVQPWGAGVRRIRKVNRVSSSEDSTVSVPPCALAISETM